MKPLLITDASVLINLLATEEVKAIGHASNWHFVICGAVRCEIVSLRNEHTGEMEIVSLDHLISSGTLSILELTHQIESDTYVEYAALVDDGEAMSLALAEHRGIAIAIDDKRAAAVAKSRNLAVPMLTTPDLIYAWQQRTQAPDLEVGLLLRKVESRARYSPPREHSLRNWWTDCSALALSAQQSAT